MTPAFEEAVGGMADIPQWFCWKLKWLVEKTKYEKVPWRDGRAVDAGDPDNWMDYDSTVAACAALRATAPADRTIAFALGFRLTDGCGYFLYDLDKCVKDGVVTELAQAQISAFPGAMLEYSSSGTGLHIIGTYNGSTPHRSMFKERNWEFYTDKRGIAFGVSGEAWGKADTMHDAACEDLIERYFKPHAISDGSVRAPEWRGPEDDDELLRRIYKAGPSAKVAFGGVASTRELMEGNPQQMSENDARLASTLAWWTGRDVNRIERIMRRSKLYRPKWDEHRPQGGSLLRHTILKSCAVVDTCFVEPDRQDTAATLVGRVGPVLPAVTQMVPTPVPGDVTYVTDYVDAAVLDASEALKSSITSAGTVRDVYNLVPAVHASRLPPMFQDQVADEFHKRLKVLNAGTSIGKVRALLFPPTTALAVSPAQLPDWARDWCFVGNGNLFFNLTNSEKLDITGFHATFGEQMPLNIQGKRMNAAEQCLHFWGMRKVSEIGYRPDRDRYYEWEGRRFANTYSPSSLPGLVAYTDTGRAGIEAFAKHLYDMCGRRIDVYNEVLYWMAHNVQRPGVKIRWSPVIKGCQGDGKGILAEVIKAAMGPRNVNITGNRALTAEFTDWAVGAAVNIIEEIYLTGEKRYITYNAMKEFISNKEVSINPKGRTTYKTWNCTNHIALTNHNDAIPLEFSDRRWFVVFTPWSSLEEMRAYIGLDEDGWYARIKLIEAAFENCAGEIRNWLLTLPIPTTFRIDSINVVTSERGKMLSSSRDSADIVAAGIIESGAVGVSEKVVSSTALIAEMKRRALTDGFEVPKGMAVNHMMTRLRFAGLEKQVWWDGKLHTVWVKDGFQGANGEVREALDTTLAGVQRKG